MLSGDRGPWRRRVKSTERKFISLSEVTISAFTEMGQAESSITVPAQRTYTSRNPVISSHLADIPCAILGVQGVLDLLNATIGGVVTSLTPSLYSLLDHCITNNYDFGMAYGRLRRLWYTRQWSTIQANFCRWEKEDREMRQKALVDNQIINPQLKPRRVWDLYCNWVVPWWSIYKTINHRNILPHPQLSPISHAWMDEKDRVDVQTPINGYEWPVPIPKDANLDLVRIEMLNLGAEYTWLDVLCLRQVGGPGEDMRMEEWKLDVPTIGAVYTVHRGTLHAVWYLGGLGRPLSLKEGDLDSDQSWFRRAWTLQEAVGKRVIAGDTLDGPLHAKPIDEDGNYETELLTRFHKQLQSVYSISGDSVFGVLESMQNQVSTNPVDKVAGLTFHLQSKVIPAYNESQSLEEAWTALVNSMDVQSWGKLFSVYPEPGNAGVKWRPSWDQVMTKLPTHNEDVCISVIRHEGIDSSVTVFDEAEEWCAVRYCIEKGFVQGLADVVEGVDRKGELIVKDESGIEHVFNIIATGNYPIPEDTYTLLFTSSYKISDWKHKYLFRSQRLVWWILGQRLSGKRFEKVAMFGMTWKEWDRVTCDQHLTEGYQCILV